MRERGKVLRLRKRERWKEFGLRERERERSKCEKEDN